MASHVPTPSRAVPAPAHTEYGVCSTTDAGGPAVVVVVVGGRVVVVVGATVDVVVGGAVVVVGGTVVEGTVVVVVGGTVVVVVDVEGLVVDVAGADDVVVVVAGTSGYTTWCTNTSDVRLVSPATRSLASDANAAIRPSPLTTGPSRREGAGGERAPAGGGGSERAAHPGRRPREPVVHVVVVVRLGLGSRLLAPEMNAT